MRSSPPRSVAMTPAKSGWPLFCWSGCAPACCAWPTGPSSASRCGGTARAAGADLVWRVRSNQVLPCQRRLPDGSYLSRLYPSPTHRRRDDGGGPVRVIEYRLDGVPDAEPLYRLITTLLDPAAAPAAELAALYHERWEEESAFAELKVTLPGKRLMLRSHRADLAEQEL